MGHRMEWWSRCRATTVALAALAVTVAACASPADDATQVSDRPPVVVDTSLGVLRVPEGAPLHIRMVLDDGDPEALTPVLEAAFRAAVEDFGAIQQGFRVDLGEVVAAGCDEESGARIGATIADGAEGVAGILGPQCTDTLLGLQAPAAAAGLVVLTPRVTLATLTASADGVIGQDREEGTWRTAPSDLAEARAAAVHAVEDLGATRAVVVEDGSLVGTESVAAFRTRFEGLGGTVVRDVRIEPDVLLGMSQDDGSEGRAAAEAALAGLLDDAAASDADIAFLPLTGELLAVLLTGWSERSALDDVPRITTIRALGGDLRAPDLLALDAALELRMTAPALDATDSVSGVTGMSGSQTLERVVATSGVTQPAGWWAFAYDAATLLLRAIDDASLVDVDGSLVLSRAELRSMIARTGFEGLTGSLRCDALGDCAAPRIAIHRHEDPSAVALVDLPIVATITH